MAQVDFSIPVVDFSSLGLQHEDRPDYEQECVRKVASEMYKAFSTSGFVYLKNHGIPKEKVQYFLDYPAAVGTRFCGQVRTIKKGRLISIDR